MVSGGLNHPFIQGSNPAGGKYCAIFCNIFTFASTPKYWLFIALFSKEPNIAVYIGQYSSGAYRLLDDHGGYA